MPVFYCVKTQASESSNYLEQLIEKARTKEIWQERSWHVLLHYVPGLFSTKYTSLVDDPKFFFSDQGKTSPQKELEATLRAFYSPQQNDDEALVCLFPARYEWLVQRLEIDTRKFPKYRCSLLHTWLKNMDADQVSMIFPVSFLNSPPSMFGHTFLRFDKFQRQQPDLLAWTVNYAAHTDKRIGLEFAYKGLTGGYQGKFSIARYFTRVKEYGDIESRDIWEYRLNYTKAEIHALLLHLWELLPVHFDYYFLDENCSYQLLALLEAARPNVDLISRFYWEAIPADTVRAVTEVPGLLDSIKYRPSNRTVIDYRIEAMNAEQQRLAKQLALGEIKIAEIQDKINNPDKQAQVLELAHDYAAYLLAIAQRKRQGVRLLPEKKQSNPENLYQLLKARNTLASHSQQPDIPKPETTPDQAHLSRRLGFRYGYEEPLHFLQLDYRHAYHALNDPQGGFISGAVLEFFNTALRYYPEKNRVQLEEFTALNILSAPTRNRFIKPFSWQARIGAKRYRFDENSRPLLGDFDFALGLSYRLPMNSRLSIFAESSFLIGEEFNQNFAIGGGGKMQYYLPVTEKYLIMLDTGILQYFQGITQTRYQLNLTQRYTVSRNNALVLSIGQKQELGDSFFSTLLSWQYYF